MASTVTVQIGKDQMLQPHIPEELQADILKKLVDLHLERYFQLTVEWCDKEGATSLDEITDNVQSLVLFIESHDDHLRHLERQRLMLMAGMNVEPVPMLQAQKCVNETEVKHADVPEQEQSQMHTKAMLHDELPRAATAHPGRSHDGAITCRQSHPLEKRQVPFFWFHYCGLCGTSLSWGVTSMYCCSCNDDTCMSCASNKGAVASSSGKIETNGGSASAVASTKPKQDMPQAILRKVEMDCGVHTAEKVLFPMIDYGVAVTEKVAETGFGGLEKMAGDLEEEAGDLLGDLEEDMDDWFD